MNDEANTALDGWEKTGADCALREGWILSETSYDTIQCQRIDDPESWVEGGLEFTPPRLPSDGDAWRIVVAGDAPHHELAREILARHSPDEWARMLAYHLQEATS